MTIKYEIERALLKHPVWPTDPFRAASVLVEEVGELVKAINEGDVVGANAEAAQVVATAIRFYQNRRNYKYVDLPE